jgi:hypothetical protein
MYDLLNPESRETIQGIAACTRSMLADRGGLVPTAGAVRMSTARLRRALHGIRLRHRDDAFVHMVLMRVVEMTIMEIINVAVMEDRPMPTVGAMLVSMIGVMFLSAGGRDRVRHRILPPWTAVYVAPPSHAILAI